VARRLSADPMNVKRCADELEARGLLRSRPVPGDRRPRGLELTERGRELACRAVQAAAAEEEWPAAVLGADGADALAATLARLEESLGLARYRTADLALVGSSRLAGSPAPRGHARGRRHARTAEGQR